jgi:DNA polymerase-3 subunit gamma/tau
VAYVVLARKYRPQRFDDMIGQEHVGRTLGNAIRQDRVHHAYLFAGARGLGKTTTARIFAKGLVCVKGPTATPCNECSECIAVNEGRSVDVIEIDGASNNSVENIRNLREQVHYLPQTARRKVYIIDEVHMLTTSAFNALLKTLEEPPAHVNFIFATTEPQKVLPTILSRVSRLDFRRVSPEEAVAHLKEILDREGLSVDEGGLRLVARAAGGSVRDALTLLDQVIAFADDPKQISEEEARAVLGQAQHSAIAELVDAVLDHDPDAAIERFDALVNAGHDLMVLSLQLLEHLRDLAVVKVCKGSGVLRGATESEYERVRAQADKAEASVLGQLFDRFTRVVDRLPDSRVPRLLLEMGLLDLVHAEPLMPLGDLLEQLHGMGDGGDERGGAPGAAPSRAGGRASGGSTGRRAEAAPAMHNEPPSAFEASSPRAEPPRAESPRDEPPRDEPPRAEPPRFEPRAEPPRFETRVEARPEPPRAAPIEAPRKVDAPAPHNGARATPAAPAAVLIGADDSELSRALWAKLETDLGDTMRVPAAKPSNGTPTRPNGNGNGHARPTPPEPTHATAIDDVARCGPCSPQPVADGLIEQSERGPFDIWEELVRRIRASDEYISAVLADLALLDLAGGVLRVAAPPRSFAYKELASRPEIRATVEQACRDHLGAPHELQLVEGEPELPARPSISLVEAQRRAAHQAAIEAEAATHASIGTLLRTFNAKITATKPIG